MSRFLHAVCLLVAFLPAEQGAALNCPSNPDPECEGKCGKCRQGIAIGDPVNALSLDSYAYTEDVSLKTSLGPLVFARRYTSSEATYNDLNGSGAMLSAPPPFGNTIANTLRWTHNFFAWARVTTSYIDFRMPSGGWRRFGKCTIPGGATQCWAPTYPNSWEGDENHVRLTTTGVEFFDEDGRIFVFDKVWPDPSTAGVDKFWFLGAVHDSSGRLIASVSYQQPAMLDGGSCRMPTDGGMPGVPYVSRITSADSTSLVMTYDGVFNSNVSPGRWECGLVRISVEADAGPPATVAQYQYIPDSQGRPTAGYLASATMASLVETYSYGGGFARWRGGTVVAQHTNSGDVVGSSSGEGPLTSFTDPGLGPGFCASPNMNLSRCCADGYGSNGVKRRATSTVVSRGDGSGQTATYSQTYYLTRPNDSVHSLYPIRIEEDCTPQSSCSPGNKLYLWALAGGSPNDICHNTFLAREMLTVDKRGNATFTPYTHNATGGSYPYQQWEKTATQWGRLTGTNGLLETTLPPFLEAENYTYRYQADNSVQSPHTVTRNSTFDGGPTVVTELRYLGGTSTSIVDAVFHTGRTLDIDGAPQDKTAAMFFGLDAGRVVEIQGPCFGASSSACPSYEPVTRFDYYPASAGNESGRLRHVYRYPGGLSTSNPLVTEYLGYSPLGDPTSIKDENQKVHTFTWVGRELRSYVLPDSAGSWSFNWENGEITSVQSPNGNFEVFCHRDGEPTTGACSGNWTKKVQWRAKAQDNVGALWGERVIYGWLNDELKNERRLVPGTNGVRSVRYFDEDGEGRPTWERTGVDAGGYVTKRFFDGAGNLTGFSQPLSSAAPPFCGGIAKSVLCSWLEHDRANRPAVFDVYPAAAQPGIRTCIDYDAQSNVKRIATGCDANLTLFTGCDVNGGSGGNANCSVPSDYQWDDFGNIVEARVANMGDGGTSTGLVRYELDARGLPLAKKTNEGTTLYTRDALGRLLTVKPAGYSETFIVSYDAATMSGCGLTPTGQAGRLAKVVDVVGSWETMYEYDASGRLLNEYRRPANASGCPFGTTSYTYDLNGNVTTITYPHGRQVTYVYAKSLGQRSRVSRVDVNDWNGTAWSGKRTLVSSVTWEPYGGLRGYHINFLPASTYATVEYMLGDDSSVPTAGSGCSSQPPVMTPGTYDGTARLRSLRVTESSSSTPTWQTGSGDLLRRGYTWSGNQVGRIDTCYRSLPMPIREDVSYDNALRLTQVDLPNFATTGGYQQRHAFTYDSRNKRVAWHVGDGGVHVGYAHAGGNTPDRLVEEKPLSGTVSSNRYGFDRDGRRNSRTWLDYSGNVAPVQLQSMAYHVGTGPDTAISDLTTPAGNYVYTYDLFGRRTQKSYPNYDADKFIYSPHGVELLEDVGVTTAGSTSSFPIDDYVWLGGRPIAQLRGNLNASEGRTSPADHSGATCERLSDGTPCDFYFIVTDHVGKPVLMLDSSRRIAGVGETEPFGRVNTVEWWNRALPAQTAGTTTFSAASQPTWGMNLDMRPYLHTVDLEFEQCGSGQFKGDVLTRLDNNRQVDGMFGYGLVNQKMAWATLTPYTNSSNVQVGTMGLTLQTDNGNCPRGVYQSSCTPTCSPATLYSGVELRRYEYRRYESVLKWASDTTWKQTLNPGSGWEQLGHNDAAWSSSADEGAQGGWPWYTGAQFPAGTPAHWIWDYDSRWSGDTNTVYFRKTFAASGTQAVITITADNSFTAYMNGVQIASGVDWWVPKVITVRLTPGTQNVLAVAATNAGGPGGLLVDVNETTTPFWTALRFPGQYFDAESELHYNGHRFYDPGLGIFTSPEPILRIPYAQVAYAYLGLSLPVYGYAVNNPIGYYDPNGLWVLPAPGDTNFWKAVDRLTQSEAGRKLWQKMHYERPQKIPFQSMSMPDEVGPGQRFGQARSPNGRNWSCRAVTNPIYNGSADDPALNLAEELAHIDAALDMPRSPESARDFRVDGTLKQIARELNLPYEPSIHHLP